MSLRLFHIVFITLTTLLALGIGALEYANFKAAGAPGYLVAASVCAVVAAGLVVYGAWFLKKTRKLIL